MREESTTENTEDTEKQTGLDAIADDALAANQ